MTGHEHIVRAGIDTSFRQPNCSAVLVVVCSSTEADRDVPIRSRMLPGRAIVQPLVRQFGLRTVFDALLEHAESITYAIAESRDVHRGHRVEEAGCESSEPTVSEPRI
jgi:hypothetical protein